MDRVIGRREVLQLGAAMATLWPGLAGIASTSQADSSRKRPYTWADAYRRTELETVAISPVGNAIAVQVTRPLSAPGAHAGWAQRAIQPRGDIWLLNEELGAPKRLQLNDQWLWAPQFSPRGKRLAALTSKGDGHVEIVAWDLVGNRRMHFASINVDLYVKFCSGMLPQKALPAVWTPLNQYSWLDDDSIVFAEHGETPAQFEQAIETASVTYSKLRESTARGDPSVRVWNADSPTCGRGRRLEVLDCKTEDIKTLYEGDVRGVSISPNGRWIAALIAKGHITVPPDHSMEPALRWSSTGDDPLVSLGLVRIDMAAELPPMAVQGFDGVGNVAPARLPVWSSDSQHFAVPSRTTFSSAYSTGNDNCWEIQVSSLIVRKWQATSALDAEVLAALIATLPESHREKIIEIRPQSTPRPTKLPLGGGQIEGSAWRYGSTYVVSWSMPTITLIGPEGIFTVPGEFAVAYAPVSNGLRASMFTIRVDGVTCEILLKGLAAEVHEHVIENDCVYMGTRASDGALIAKRESESGTSIAAFVLGNHELDSALRFNGYFKDIEKAARREIVYQTNEGEKVTGVLQLPIGRAPDDRHPVIVWAYPDQQPSLNDSMTRLNSPYAINFPLQYLLTRGFAVFHAPLSTRRKQIGKPLEMVTNAVLPSLDALGQQPEIISGEYGYYGHSNAGYVGLALEVTTPRFKCIVASSTFPDLGARNLSSPPDKLALECAGQVLQAERRSYEDASQPYTFGAPFWKAESQFIQNSPLYRMGSASTPLLLIEGEFDSSPRDMESVYSILTGRGIPVELAMYWGEAHVINSPGNIRDVWLRTEAFFRRYLRMA